MHTLFEDFLNAALAAKDRKLAQRDKRRKSAGWQVGDAADFLNLAEEEAASVESKLRDK